MDREEAETRYRRSMAKIAFRRHVQILLSFIIIATALSVMLIMIDSVCATNKILLEDTTYLREQTVPAEESEEEQLYKCLGTFEVTYYCPCEKCCGNDDGITATGTVATEGRTIGVDPDVIPYGSEVIIDGHTYVAEDTGNIEGNKIDIYVESHEMALSLGRHETLVFVAK